MHAQTIARAMFSMLSRIAASTLHGCSKTIDILTT
jgi:hypothetical protein